MPGERRLGMDHEHYDWSPIVKREAFRWPENARVALCAIVNLDHLEWSPPEGSHLPAGSGALGTRPFPDYARFSHREYGHRVGIFRVLDVLERHGIPATVAMDSMTAENYPYLVRHCLDRGSEIVGHGISASRMITGNMSEREERELVQTALQFLRKATGSAPAGWFGPEYGESSRTPQILAEEGIRYVCDWANDEQPYRLKTPGGELYALPIMFELDDVNALAGRRVAIDRYEDMLKEGFDVMYRDGTQRSGLLVLNLHPWLIGQPFRIGYLDRALAHMTRRQGVWAATGSEIIDWYRQHPPVG